MRLAGVPFWSDATTPVGDTGVPPETPSTSAVTPLLPTVAQKQVINEARRTGAEVNGNYDKVTTGASLVPPFRVPSTFAPSNYGAITVPIGLNNGRPDPEDDDSDDEEANRGFPSEAGWSARMRRPTRRNKRESSCLQYLGIILILCHTIFSSLSGLTVKLLEKEFHPYNICFWRFCTVFTISLLVMSYTKLFTKIKLWPRPLVEEKHEHAKNVLLLLLRGVLGCAGRILYIFSITCMNLSDAMVIASASPVFMTFFAYFLLGENCGIVPILVAIITLIGVGIITRPPWLTGQGHYDANILVGTGTGFSGMILTTLVMIVMRKLRHVNVTLITISFASCGAVAAFILCLHEDVFVVPTENLRNVLLLIASGATSFLGQTFLTLGLKYENAGVVALLTNFSVVFSFIFEYIFIHIAPDIYSITGGFVVIFCIVVTTIRKWIGNLPEYNQVRRRLSFLLR